MPSTPNSRYPDEPEPDAVWHNDSDDWWGDDPLAAPALPALYPAECDCGAEVDRPGKQCPACKRDHDRELEALR